MTTNILTDEQIESIAQQYTVTAPDGNVVTTGPWRFARAIEQAVLQSDEVNRLRADAERYRWFRDAGYDNLKEANCITSRGTPFGGLVLDTAIDAAMEKQP